LADFALNLSSLNGLRFCVESDAQVFGIKELHSKVYLFDTRSAIVTSANLTSGGLVNNYECGLLIDDQKTVNKLHAYFEELRHIGKEPLTLQRCEEWAMKLNTVSFPNNVATSLPDYGKSQTKIDTSKRYFVKFFGTSKNRVPLTYRSKDEVERALCHYACGFSAARKPRQFQDGDIVYLSRMTERPDDYAIFGRAEAIKFVEGRDRATEREILERDWKADWPIYLRVRNAVFINGSMGDCVLLYDLVRKLDFESFPTTKSRYEDGERNINPFRTLSQQPYVELTEKGAEWLESRFQSALGRVGRIDERFLNSLPQSDIEISDWTPS